MARTEQLEQHQRKQRRLAILALLAHRPQPTGTCLKDETLAALVEGKLDQPEVDRCLAHMAECDTCSSLWLQLDQHWQSLQPQKKRSRIYRLLTKPKVLTALGSSLAVAASIAVFLTITTRMDQNRLYRKPLHQEQAFEAMPPQEPPSRMTTMPTPAPATTGGELQKNQGETAPTADSPAPFAQKNVPSQRPPRIEPDRKQRSTDTAPEKKPDAVGRTADFFVQEPESISPAVVPEPFPETAARTALRAPAPSLTSKAGAIPLNLETWEISLRHGCEQSAEAKDLTHLAEQGRQLLAAESLDTPQQELIRAILDQLAGNNEHAERCRRILELLAPERTEQKR